MVNSRVWVAVLILACAMPYPAFANCARGRTADYNDVMSVSVQRGGVASPIYRFDVSNNGMVTFSGKWKTPIIGDYYGDDGNRMFKQILATLRSWDFYSMRLKMSPNAYLDGPFDTVAVMRCGVITEIGTLGGAGLPFEARLNDPETDRFIHFVDSLQASIFAWPWSGEHLAPTPKPSPLQP